MLARIKKLLQNHSLKGAIWIVFGFGGAQILRLLSNLVLTRLLFPEMFGVMGVANAIWTGIRLFSDIGLRESVIRHQGDDYQVFRNTVWSMQVVRGFFVFAFICILAYPVELFFNHDGLAQILIVIGISAIFGGVTPTKLIEQEKQLNFSMLVRVELSAQFISIAFMIFAAWLTQSIWALVLGTVVNQLAITAIIYWYVPGEHNQWHFDRQSFSKIFRYGRWIFLSTVVTFLTNHAETLIIGKWVSMAQLGIYTIALVFARLITRISEALSSRLLFPVYSHLFTQSQSIVNHDDVKTMPEESPSKVSVDAASAANTDDQASADQTDSHKKVTRVRWAIILAIFPVSLFISIFGDWIIQTLYDDRYLDAGWMLQIMSVVTFFWIFGTTLEPYLLAVGNSKANMLVQLLRGTLLMGAMIYGLDTFGIIGFFWAMLLVPIVVHPILLWTVYQHRFQRGWVDFPILAVFAVIVLGIWSLQASPSLQKLLSIF